MLMATVMMSTTLKPVFLMVEIANLMLIQHIAENVNALKEEGIVEGLQHPLELQHLSKL